MGTYCLPSCDWFSRWVYTVSPPVIGSHDGYIVQVATPPLESSILPPNVNGHRKSARVKSGPLSPY
eukprot:1190410-Prorocentrum_minimum.AAC.3